MRAAAVIYILGWLMTSAAAAMLVPTAFAVALDPALVFEAFLFPAVVIGFIGVNMLIAFRARDMAISRRQSLAVLVLIWVLMPLAGALPLYSAGFPGELVPAIFEATSGFTTTGASVISEFATVPRSIIVWRGLLQWMGGLVTLLLLAALLGPLWEGNLTERQFRLFGKSEQRIFPRIAEAIRVILPIYMLVTLLCFLCLMLSGLPSFDAFCLSLSTVSTGGFMPREGTIALYGSTSAEFVLAIFMALSSISILWVRAVFSGRWTFVKDMREPYFIAVAIVIFGGVLTLLMLKNAPVGGFGDVLDTVALSLATAASLISTTGFMISEPAHSLIPYMVVLAVAIIGGGAFSTAGGLKVYRLWAMFRQIGRELRLLVYPHGVRPSADGDEIRDERLMMAIWTTFGAYIITIAVLAIALAASGLAFEGALLAAASSVSNIGPAYEIIRVNDFPDAPSYANMAPWTQIALCGGMILGRGEVLVLLSLLSTTYWRD